MQLTNRQQAVDNLQRGVDSLQRVIDTFLSSADSIKPKAINELTDSECANESLGYMEFLRSISSVCQDMCRDQAIACKG